MLLPSAAPEKLRQFIFPALQRVSRPGPGSCQAARSPSRRGTADTALRVGGRIPLAALTVLGRYGMPARGSGGPGPGPRTTTSDRPQARAALAQHKDPFQGSAPLSRPSSSVSRPGSSSGPGGKVFTAETGLGFKPSTLDFSSVSAE